MYWFPEQKLEINMAFIYSPECISHLAKGQGLSSTLLYDHKFVHRQVLSLQRLKVIFEF